MPEPTQASMMGQLSLGSRRFRHQVTGRIVELTEVSPGKFDKGGMHLQFDGMPPPKYYTVNYLRRFGYQEV